MKYTLALFCLHFHIISCNGQPSNRDRIGGPCDGCELVNAGMPDEISSSDTSSGWTGPGQKLVITGKVLQPDGKTPAPGVIIYYYHTDHTGRYAAFPGMDENIKRHGKLRGWVKSGKEGDYSIHTIRPAAYPGGDEPAHIHFMVKEPGLSNEYYIDDRVFDDDRTLTTKKRRAMQNRGGSGILRVLIRDSIQIAENNIITGMNIPGHPAFKERTSHKGLQIGDDSPSFLPFHAWGPDSGKRVCPLCKYGRYHGILMFAGGRQNAGDLRKWLRFLERESGERKKHLRVFLVYGNEKDYSTDRRQQELARLGAELGLQNVSLTFVPSMRDEKTEVSQYGINPEASNTFIIYRHRNIVGKFIDLDPVPENFELIIRTLDETSSRFFDLPEPAHD